MRHFQKMGIALGETSEQGQEASNWDNKNNYTRHSRRFSLKASNIDAFHKSWWTTDFYVMKHFKMFK